MSSRETISIVPDEIVEYAAGYYGGL